MKKLLLCLFAVIISISVFSKNIEEVITKDALSGSNTRIDNSALTVKVPKYIFSGLNSNIELIFNDPSNAKLIENNYELFFIVNGQDMKVKFNKSGVGTFAYSFNESNKMNIYFEDFSYTENLHIIPLAYILAPVGLLVLFLGFKLVRAGRKNKLVIINETELVKVESPLSEKVISPIGEVKKDKITVKEVVEVEEEMFA